MLRDSISSSNIKSLYEANETELMAMTSIQLGLPNFRSTDLRADPVECRQQTVLFSSSTHVEERNSLKKPTETFTVDVHCGAFLFHLSVRTPNRLWEASRKTSLRQGLRKNEERGSECTPDRERDHTSPNNSCAERVVLLCGGTFRLASFCAK